MNEVKISVESVNTRKCGGRCNVRVCVSGIIGHVSRGG